MKSSEYWAIRSRNRMRNYHRNSDNTIRTVHNAYDKALADIEEDIGKIYTKYKLDSGLTDEEVRKILNSRVDPKVLDELRAEALTIKDKDIRKQIINRLNAPAYKARITRLEALKENIYLQAKKVADVELQASESVYIDTINKSYYQTMFEIQKGTGYGFNVASMLTKDVQEVLRNPWSGRHFSERIWRNSDLLAEQLTKTMTSGFMSGRTVYQMTQELGRFMGTGKHVTARLIRTELTYMANAAEIEGYIESGIEEYMYLATLDDRTSDVCQDLDNEVFKVADAKAGENLPPMHPHCRSTTRAWFGEKTLEGIQRRARDPITGRTYLVPASMKYKEWFQEYVKEAA